MGDAVNPVIAWRVGVVLAALFCAWKFYDLIGDNRELRTAVSSLTQGIRNLDERADRYDQALAANATFDDTTRGQAGMGVAHNESARRHDREVIAIDKPWPAAMRRRVFDNPDPASGSTATERAAAAGKRGEPVPITR